MLSNKHTLVFLFWWARTYTHAHEHTCTHTRTHAQTHTASKKVDPAKAEVLLHFVKWSCSLWQNKHCSSSGVVLCQSRGHNAILSQFFCIFKVLLWVHCLVGTMNVWKNSEFLFKVQTCWVCFLHCWTVLLYLSVGWCVDISLALWFSSEIPNCFVGLLEIWFDFIWGNKTWNIPEVSSIEHFLQEMDDVWVFVYISFIIIILQYFCK